MSVNTESIIQNIMERISEIGYVKPEDVAFVFIPGIAHRVVLSQEARLNRESAQTILAEILHAVEVPYAGNR